MSSVDCVIHSVVTVDTFYTTNVSHVADWMIMMLVNISIHFTFRGRVLEI